MYKRTSAFIQEVLELPQWDDEKFQGLLTSNIWQSNIETIKYVLNIPEWPASQEAVQNCFVAEGREPPTFSTASICVMNSLPILFS